MNLLRTKRTDLLNSVVWRETWQPSVTWRHSAWPLCSASIFRAVAGWSWSSMAYFGRLFGAASSRCAPLLQSNVPHSSEGKIPSWWCCSSPAVRHDRDTFPQPRPRNLTKSSKINILAIKSTTKFTKFSKRTTANISPFLYVTMRSSESTILAGNRTKFSTVLG